MNKFIFKKIKNKKNVKYYFLQRFSNINFRKKMKKRKKKEKKKEEPNLLLIIALLLMSPSTQHAFYPLFLEEKLVIWF